MKSVTTRLLAIQERTRDWKHGVEYYGVVNMTSEQGFNKVPEHGWTCFHCGEHFAPTFGGQQAARHHFGDSPIEQPACTIDARAFRAMQDLCARYQSEDTELHREIQRLQAEHAVALRRVEEQGYARGLEGAKRYPETLGLTRMAT